MDLGGPKIDKSRSPYMKGELLRGKLPAQDMLRHVQQFLYSKRLNRGTAGMVWMIDVINIEK